MKLKTRLFIALAAFGVIMTVMGVKDWACMAKPAKDITELWEYDYNNLKPGDHICFDVTLVWDQIGSEVTTRKTYGVTTSETESNRYYLIPFCQDEDEDYIYPTPFLLAKIPSRYNAALDSQISKSDAWWESDADFSEVPKSTIHLEGRLSKIPKDIRVQLEECTFSGESLMNNTLPVMYETTLSLSAARGLSLAGIVCLAITGVIVVLMFKGKSAQGADYGMPKMQGTGYVPKEAGAAGPASGFGNTQPQNTMGNYGQVPLGGQPQQNATGSFGAPLGGQSQQNATGSFGAPIGGQPQQNTMGSFGAPLGGQPQQNATGSFGAPLGGQPQQNTMGSFGAPFGGQPAPLGPSEPSSIFGNNTQEAASEPASIFEPQMSEEERAAAEKAKKEAQEAEEKAKKEEEARAEMLRAMAYASSHPAVLPLGGGGEAVQPSSQAATLPLGVSPTQVSSGPSATPAPEQPAGAAESSSIASQPAASPVNGSAPTQENNNPIFGSAPTQQNNNPIFGSAPTQQNNNPIFGSAPTQENNNPMFGSTPAQQNNNPIFGSAPAQQNNNPIYGSTPAQPNNGLVSGNAPTQQNNNPLYGSAPVQPDAVTASAEEDHTPLYADNTEMKQVFSGAFANNNNSNT